MQEARFRSHLFSPESDVGVSDGIRLATEAVSVSFEGLRALSDVTLSIAKGEIIGLIGPNGAGKTTLVNCLTGFQKPSAGRVTLGLRDTASWKTAKFSPSRIARTFQGGRLFRDMTVQQNVEVTAVALGLSRRAAAHEAALLLDWMGIGHLRAGLQAHSPIRTSAGSPLPVGSFVHLISCCSMNRPRACRITSAMS